MEDYQEQGNAQRVNSLDQNEEKRKHCDRKREIKKSFERQQLLESQFEQNFVDFCRVIQKTADNNIRNMRVPDSLTVDHKP